MVMLVLRSSLARLALAVLTSLVLSGCSLPRGGPVRNEVLQPDTAGAADFGIVAVSRANLATVAQWPHPQAAAHRGWPQGGQRGGSLPGGGSIRIASGDAVSLTIWENDDNALLTAQTQKSVQINDVTVGPDGTIFVPYIGDIPVGGQTPDQARKALQTQLEGVLSSPQVQLSLTPGRKNTVDLVGGVLRAGSYPLPDRNFSVLGLLSQGGGISAGLRNPQLRLVRDGAVHAISASRLMADPRLDTVLRGGDKLIVEQDPRYFLALGAASQQNQIYFPQDTVSALEALALIGGVSAGRANPESILILRDYPASARLRHSLGSNRGPDHDRMIFTLDLTTADGLFSARQFRIEPDDLVLVTESPVNGLRTIMGILGQGFGLANAAPSP
ncbi:MAG: polysaccharide biosynthesis/export family protein [Paracoccaceae bacterium]|nr:polysaccharide biosynthesis/export family protein [Paracoccaceae bacterium]